MKTGSFTSLLQLGLIQATVQLVVALVILSVAVTSLEDGSVAKEYRHIDMRIDGALDPQWLYMSGANGGLHLQSQCLRGRDRVWGKLPS